MLMPSNANGWRDATRWRKYNETIFVIQSAHSKVWFRGLRRGELGENLSRPRPIPPGEPKPAIDSEKSEKQRKIKKDIGKQWQVQTLLHYRPVDWTLVTKEVDHLLKDRAVLMKRLMAFLHRETLCSSLTQDRSPRISSQLYHNVIHPERKSSVQKLWTQMRNCTWCMYLYVPS